MMTIADIEDTLPWGFHDADLLSVRVDFAGQLAVFDLDVPMDERQTTSRRGQLVVEGLVFCVIDPSQKLARGPAWIDSGNTPTAEAAKLPPVPAGAFLHWFFLHDSNSFIHVAGTAARFAWTAEPESSSTSRHGFALPGDEV
jgi:hypothetical protein